MKLIAVAQFCPRFSWEKHFCYFNSLESKVVFLLKLYHIYFIFVSIMHTFFIKSLGVLILLLHFLNIMLDIGKLSWQHYFYLWWLCSSLSYYQISNYLGLKSSVILESLMVDKRKWVYQRRKFLHRELKENSPYLYTEKRRKL